MYSESNHIAETLEKFYLHRAKKLSENPASCNALQTMIMAAEMDALSEVMRGKATK